MTEDPTCPDFVPDFGDLQHETGWWYHSCERMHPDDPAACVGKLATLDQSYSAAEEFDRRFASQPVIVGTYGHGKSAWRLEALAPAYAGDDAPGWLGVDPEVLEALKCDHLRAGPRPAFRWAESPWWLFCHNCHVDLVMWSTVANGLRCKRCRCILGVDNLRIRALISSDLLVAAVCPTCARAFDSAEPRAADAPQPGTAIYAARLSEKVSIEDFARRMREAGVMKQQESDTE